MTVPTMSPERAREILERRARELARPLTQKQTEGTIDVVEFQIAGERYAMESREVLAVFALADLVPLPGAVPPTVGLTIWRGALLTLLDIRAALGLSVAALNDLRAVIVLGDSRSSIGILVDTVQGLAQRLAADFRVSAQSPSEYARGLSAEAVMLVDGNKLARQHAHGGTQE